MDKQSSYARTRERLEEIVAQVKAKDMPLEKSLDLYEEALRLGNVCAEMIDRTDFSVEELQAVEDAAVAADEDAAVADAESADGTGTDAADVNVTENASDDDAEGDEADERADDADASDASGVAEDTQEAADTPR
jgi:exodeoxyribonuclease VII small subunit